MSFTPCYFCKHFKVKQTEQFTLYWSCEAEKEHWHAFETVHGCCLFKDKRKKKDRGDPKSLSTGQKKNSKKNYQS